MNRPVRLLFVPLALVACASLARFGAAQGKKPNVVGDWTGMWGVYAPPKEGQPPTPDKYNAQQKQMDCKVVILPDGKWQATFEGECGRPYKYTVKMLGRQIGDSVMFSGTADLGEKDGGIYDWIGRATDQDFIGFFTSARYTGNFRLGRPKPAN